MIALLLSLAIAAEVTIVTVPFRDNVSMMLLPAGSVEVEREGTITSVRVEVERAQAPTTLGPSLFCYVVWAVSPEGAFENLGELAINNGKGRLQTATRLDQLGILVTAEPHYRVDRPSAAVAFRNQAPRNTSVRRVTINVETGAYDYSNLQLPPQGAVPAIISQSRAAVRIAGDAGAERWAESEFRLARVALDTTEEMLQRAAPMEIVSFTAHEAVRRSQQALHAARERAAEMAVEDLEKEVGELSEQTAQLNQRVGELTAQLAAANAEMRNLTNQIAATGRANAELAEQKEQAETAVQNFQRELSDLKRRQQTLQDRLSITLRPEYFDESGLTPGGREALARLCGIADAVPGPIQITGFPSEVAFQAVMLYMVEAGVPHDRIITRR